MWNDHSCLNLFTLSPDVSYTSECLYNRRSFVSISFERNHREKILSSNILELKDCTSQVVLGLQLFSDCSAGYCVTLVTQYKRNLIRPTSSLAVTCINCSHILTASMRATILISSELLAHGTRRRQNRNILIISWKFGASLTFDYTFGPGFHRPVGLYDSNLCFFLSFFFFYLSSSTLPTAWMPQRRGMLRLYS